MRWALALIAALLLAGGAEAHTSIEGAEGFFRGLAHPVMEPMQGVLAGSFGLLAARAERQAAFRALVLAFALAVLAALVTALVFNAVLVPTWVLASGVLACGLGLAAFRHVPGVVPLGLALIAGPVLGSNAVSEGAAGQLATSLGSLAGASVMAIYLGGLGTWLAEREARLDWLHLAPRIAGAWVAATAMLVLAFAVQGGGG